MVDLYQGTGYKLAIVLIWLLNSVQISTQQDASVKLGQGTVVGVKKKSAKMCSIIVIINNIFHYSLKYFQNHLEHPFIRISVFPMLNHLLDHYVL